MANIPHCPICDEKPDIAWSEIGTDKIVFFCLSCCNNFTTEEDAQTIDIDNFNEQLQSYVKAYNSTNFL